MSFKIWCNNQSSFKTTVSFLYPVFPETTIHLVSTYCFFAHIARIFTRCKYRSLICATFHYSCLSYTDFQAFALYVVFPCQILFFKPNQTLCTTGLSAYSIFHGRPLLNSVDNTSRTQYRSLMYTYFNIKFITNNVVNLPHYY